MSTPLLGPAYTRGSSRVRELTAVQQRVRDRILALDSPADYEPNPQCLCGASAAEVVLADVDRHGLPATQVICRNCGLVRLSPRWSQERYRRFYEHEYRDLYNPIANSKRDFVRRMAVAAHPRGVAEWVRAVWARRGDAKAPVVVELGAGPGWNLAGLPAEWERIAYDVDETFLGLGSELFGISTKWGYLDQALDDVSRADIVLLSHLVEHLSHPEDSLSTIGAALPREGLALIEVPGIFRIHRTRLDVMAYMQDAHLYTFCADTLAASCARVGLELLELDETVRAVCRPGRRDQVAQTNADTRLWRKVVRYLRLCETGYSTLIRLRKTPRLGRYLGYAWKRLYFPWLALVKPRGTNRHLPVKASGGRR